jgi:hypothetical protein
VSGVSSTSGIGSVTQSASVALSGQVITCGQGQFDDQHGQVIFSEQGSLGPGIVMPALTGQSIASGQGSVTVATTGGNDVTVHITGTAVVVAQSSVIPAGVLSGSASTSAAGTATPSSEKALTGIACTSSAGTVTPNLGVDDTFIASAAGTVSPGPTQALTGSAMTSAQGSVSASAADKTASLVIGENDRIIVAIDFFGKTTSSALIGQAVSLSQGNFGAPGFAALTGISATVGQGFMGRALRISGQEITSAQGTVVGVPGLVALVGESMTAGQGSMEPSGTQWTPEGQPTTTWTPPASPNSSWTRKDGPSTSWNRKT